MRGRERGGGVRAAGFLAAPVGVLVALFVGPLAILLVMSFVRVTIAGVGGYTLGNYGAILEDPLYLRILGRTAAVATGSMLAMLALSVPLAYLLAFRAGRLELPLLLALVLADELNPLIRIYAWRMLLGREGLVNSALLATGLVDRPVDALLFSWVAVAIVLSASWLPYVTIPIYAAMKAIDPGVLDAARDLGAGFATVLRRILLPLAAPGIFVSLILVYIPLFAEFATPALVGGTSGYLIGNVIQEQVLELGDWGVG
ncbi:MAG TPA: ABC transporter permease, partial [Actinomycetota bacterium]|nr:ABC transporter permease [Actinomycetota bacterium]